MDQKFIKKTLVSNMFLWILAILLPILMRAFSSKDPKIFDILIPFLQFMIAFSSTLMMGSAFQTVAQTQKKDQQV